MRNITAQFLAALLGARDNGIVPRTFVYITAKRIDDGSPVTLGMWTGDDDINIGVVSGITGNVENRVYYGALNLVIGDIPRVSDMTIQTLTIEMSQVAAVTQILSREYDLRLAKVEVHEMTLDVRTRQPSAIPQVAFLGEIDSAPLTTPAIGQDGKVSLSVNSDAISMLARINPAKSSFEGQKRRNGDGWGRYASTVATWNIQWGQK